MGVKTFENITHLKQIALLHYLDLPPFANYEAQS